MLEMHTLKLTLMKSYAGTSFDHGQSPVRDSVWGSQVA